MSAAERQQQFEEAIRGHAVFRQDARVARNFGFSNSARVIEGGLFACTNNLETYSAALAGGRAAGVTQFIFLCVLTFPPQDEVYFAIVATSDAQSVNSGLLELFHEGERRNAALHAAGQKEGKISNNVKFYITDEGKLLFHNYDFLESVRTPDPAGGPYYSASVDSILFAIWPPQASARRGLLAREFVGYLGSLIGREKVHELRVWTDAATVSPEMRRLPESIDVEEIEETVRELGGYYPGAEVRRIHAALNFLRHKHFVILSGLSGTGKTQLALKYARAVHGITGNDGADPFLFVCPVRPEWTDPTGLTGYYDVLSNRYVVPQFLEAVLLATAHRGSPVFVVLDEMNLARVEYYFSDVLSAVETRGQLQLHSSGVPLESSTGIPVPAALPVPDNLYIIGTINIDETTNPVSDKVLDRAVVIDMTVHDLNAFFDALETREPELKVARAACEPPLFAAQEIMARYGLGFGYRVAEEVLRYQSFAATKRISDACTVTDDLMVQKVLVKLRGGERQRQMLTELSKSLSALPRTSVFLERLISDLDEFGSFQASR